MHKSDKSFYVDIAINKYFEIFVKKVLQKYCNCKKDDVECHQVEGSGAEW